MSIDEIVEHLQTVYIRSYMDGYSDEARKAINEAITYLKGMKIQNGKD